MPMDPEKLERMKAAMRAVSDGMSIRTAAKTYKVNHEPLRRRVLELVPVDAVPGTKLKYVSEAADRGLVEAIQYRSHHDTSVKREDLRKMIRRAAELTSTRPLPKEFPNRKWIQRWVAKHPELSYQAAQGYCFVAAEHVPDEPIPSESQTSKKRSTEAEQSCMVEWLTKRGNFELLSSPTGSFVMTKREGYEKLVEFMARKNIVWTPKQTSSRYDSLVASYRKAKKQTQRLSPLHSRLDKLFASRGPNSRDCILTVQAVCDEGPASVPSVPAVVQAVQEPVSEPAAMPASEPAPSVFSASTSAPAPTQLTLEVQRLTVQELQLQLQIAKLKAEESGAQRRADMVANLVNAGKTADEIRQIIALL